MRKLVFIGWLFLFGIAEGMDLSHVEFYLKVNNLSGAKKALQEEYQKATSQDDKEQLQYMLAQVALREKDLPQATAIFRKMLAENPALLRVRYELAYLYFLQKEDDSARYHARLALTDKNLLSQIKQTGRSKILIFGIETHICVFQTVQALLAEGFDVTVIKDVCGSRTEFEYTSALDCMLNYGAKIKTVEMVLFELIKSAKHSNFKEIQALIK